jgi:hypothetical protein
MAIVCSSHGVAFPGSEVDWWGERTGPLLGDAKHVGGAELGVSEHVCHLIELLLRVLEALHQALVNHLERGEGHGPPGGSTKPGRRDVQASGAAQEGRRARAQAHGGHACVGRKSRGGLEESGSCG